MEGYGFSDEEEESEIGGEQLPFPSSAPCQSSVNSTPDAWSITSIFFPAPNPTYKAVSVFLKNTGSPKPTVSVSTPSPRAENSIIALTVTLGLELASHLRVMARDVYQSLLGSHPSPCGLPHQNIPGSLCSTLFQLSSCPHTQTWEAGQLRRGSGSCGLNVSPRNSYVET